MKIEIFPDADAVAKKAAEIIAAEARAAVKSRGRFNVAVSGGHTPWQMLRALTNEDGPCQGVNVVQVDERVAPEETRIETSPICVKACLSMRRCGASRSMQCRWKRRKWKAQPNAMAKLSKRSPARRRCSTLSISASDPTATLPPSYREIRF